MSNTFPNSEDHLKIGIYCISIIVSLNCFVWTPGSLWSDSSETAENVCQPKNIQRAVSLMHSPVFVWMYITDRDAGRQIMGAFAK